MTRSKLQTEFTIVVSPRLGSPKAWLRGKCKRSELGTTLVVVVDFRSGAGPLLFALRKGERNAAWT